MNKISILVFALSMVGCNSPVAETESHSVTIMTFNVENLFDNEDDAGKTDETFFALSDKQSEEHKATCNEIEVGRWRDQCLNWDWNDEILEQKLRVVAEAILQVDDGRGADIVALQEIENISILERLRTEYLGDAGYLPAILIDGYDLRGVDVAFLSKLELANEPILHRPDFSDFEEWRVLDTRGVLQADFVLPDGSTMTGFSVHFPAPHQPIEMRDVAYDHLNELRSALPAGRLAFAAGDFNTTAKEDREQNMLDKHVRAAWAVAHELGCGDCKGTYYYGRDDTWSFLDMILWSAGADSGAQATWNIRNNSVYVANGLPIQVRSDHTPARFQLPEGSGVSDHWPLVMSIELK
jgi:endonuclease/exonuclease/phosphatase family metal-dependent hydrolase